MNDFMDRTDDELVSRAQRGERAAFEALYDRHAPGVCRSLASFAGPERDLLDDLTQEVFFRVIDHIHSYSPVRPFTHWLYTIALNIGRNHARARSKIILLDPQEMEALSGGTGAARDLPDELLEMALMREAARLPLKLREVVSLRIGSCLPYGEIAEILGIPEGTARSRMNTAVNMLREWMGVDKRRSNSDERQV